MGAVPTTLPTPVGDRVRVIGSGFRVRGVECSYYNNKGVHWIRVRLRLRLVSVGTKPSRQSGYK